MSGDRENTADGNPERRLFVSVVIATLNRHDALCDTLAGLFAQDYADMEVIIVDQTPVESPRLNTMLQSAPRPVRYLRVSRKGVSFARNAGVRQSTGDIVLFVDDDVSVPRDLVSSHARHYREPRIGAVTGLVLNRAEEPLHDALNVLIEAQDAPRDTALGSVCEVSWAPTVHLSVRRSVILSIGMFDEALPGNYAEDVDLSCRVRFAGYRLIADTAIVILHLCLPRGGCELRNSEMREQKTLEAFRCIVYCRLKHLPFNGVWRTCALVFRSYRGYALNRPSIANGSILRKHWAAVRQIPAIVDALRRRRRSGECSHGIA